MRKMVILGIDPGTHRMGYGIVKKENGRLIFVDAGLIKIKSDKGSGALLDIKNGLENIIKKFKPEVAAVEKVYFSKNVKTAISVSGARGAAILTALDMGLKIQEYSPNEVKKGVAGHGFADKKSVFKMIKLILNEPDLNLIDDASDALALAIMCAGSIRDYSLKRS